MKWDGITAMKYVGLANLRSLLESEEFRFALANTVLWIIAGTFIHTPIGLILALILCRRPKGWVFFRTVFFLPNILSVASLALLWYFLLNPTIGPIDAILRAAGLPQLAKSWLSQTSTALIANQLPFVLYIGFTMLIFLAQITVIPREYFEASEIEGATKFQQDMLLTLPLIRRAIVINILFNASFCLKMVEYPLIMTSGGPANATLTLPLFMYHEMTRARQFGLTMATGIFTILLGSLFMGLIFLFQKMADMRWG